MSRKEPILLNINDNEANRYAVTRMLRAAGFHVLEGGTGAEALRLSSEVVPDLVVLDVKLPDLNGIEVCRRLKADPRTATIAVLHLSANYIRPENKVEGLDSGADGYLAQPVDTAELLATVRALLRMRQAEEEARAAALQWTTTFDSLGDGVCMLDREGRVMRANRSFVALLGLPEEKVLGRPFEELMRAAAGSEAELPPSCGSVPSCQDETEVCLGERWFRVAANPVRGADGEVTGAVRILTDITRRQELEDALRQRAADLAEADRRKDEFLAMLAHELRNPLAAIVNALRLSEATAPGAEGPGPKALSVMVRQSQHMARMVDDLLDVSRFNRGHIELRRTPVDLRQVVQHSVEARRRALQDKGLHVEVSLPASDGLWLNGDATRLEQVVSNLVDNAVKYTDSGGHVFVGVTVEAEGGGRQAVLRVRDTGIGMSPRLMARVFELFVQAEQQLDRSRGGLGIGLTLVRRLVDLHGGKVSVHSEGEGKGSEVTVRLPLAAEQVAPAPAPEVKVSGSEGPGSRRVLLVEDNDDAREVLRDLVEMWGHRVEVAENGPKGVQLFQALRPHVALVDLGLPGMDGFQVARRIRESEGGKDVFLVALTGYSGDHQKKAVEAGFNLHIVKPVDPDELERLLEKLPAPEHSVAL
ncbi:response regulator [Archangium sp.]|uniref:hybrid sensor histidine kinase/response regulator n=1 Tax=Archangium sp. TaxID=1872627 RepID=UPI00286ADC89|nr:response regulator [Archangium sp.]